MTIPDLLLTSEGSGKCLPIEECVASESDLAFVVCLIGKSAVLASMSRTLASSASNSLASCPIIVALCAS